MKQAYTLLLAALLTPMLALAQNVGIGTTQPTQTLDVNGNLRVRAATGAGTRLLQADATGTLSPAATTLPANAAATPALAATATGLNNPLVAASGTLAVVLNRGANPVSLSLYDISTPASPVLRGSYSASGFTNLVSVAISGTTAAVISGASPYTISIFTLSSGAPVLAGTATPTGAGSAGGGVAMVGNLLYAACDKSFSQGLLYVYDVSNPASPVQRNATAGTSIGLFTPIGIAAAGNLVSITSPYNNGTQPDQLTVLDVSNPAAPVVVGNVGGTSASNYTGSARPAAMSAGLAVVVQPENNRLTTYDLSTPAAPVVRSTFTTATTPVGVALSGTLAYVACAGSNTLQVIDVSGATATLRGTAALDATAQSVAVTSAAVLAANKAAANDLQIFAQPTRTVVVYPDGTTTTAAAPGAADFIQNQTAAAQSAGFNISGAGTVGGALAVSGATALNGGAAIAGNATVSGTTTLAGPATLNNNLNVYGLVNLASGATINSATISNSASVGGALTVSGSATVNGTTTLGGPATINNTATITGATIISGATAVRNTLTVGPTGALGKVLTPTTGTHNMLAVAYGQVNSSSNVPNSSSGNYSVTHTGTGLYTITFPVSSGLNAVSLDTYPIVMSLWGNSVGFVSWSAYSNAAATTVTNGALYVTTFDKTGAPGDATFTFVMFQP